MISLSDVRGVARNLAKGGQILDRKPHLLINAKTGSDYRIARIFRGSKFSPIAALKEFVE